MRYDPVAVLLHWAMTLLVAAQVSLGWWMLSLPDKGGGQLRWFNLHKSIGLTLGLLAAARLAWRARHPAPPLPLELPPWQRRAAGATHAGLYGCLIALPLAGYLGSSFSGYPIRYFGWMLPSWGWKWPAAKSLLSSLHLGLAWLLAALVCLHVAGAFSHLGTFGRMWRWRSA